MWYQTLIVIADREKTEVVYLDQGLINTTKVNGIFQ